MQRPKIATATGHRSSVSMALITGTLLMLILIVNCSAVAASAPAEEVKPVVTAIILVIDTSGSMAESWRGGVKMSSAQNAAFSLIDLMAEENELSDREYQIAVVSFDTSARIVCPLTADLDTVRSAVASLAAHGWTNIGHGLELAKDMLSRAQYDQASILLLSDGITNRGRSSSEIIAWLDATSMPQASVYGHNYRHRTDRRDTINTTKQAQRAGTTLDAGGFDTSTHLSVPAATALGRLEDDCVFVFCGHGNVDLLSFVDQETGNPSWILTRDVRGLAPLQLQLAVLAGCLTGTISDQDSIMLAFTERGTRVGVGFSSVVRFLMYRNWFNRFWSGLAQGHNVKRASELGTTIGLHGWRETLGRLWYLDWRIVVAHPISEARKMTLAGIISHCSTIPIHTVGFGEPEDLDEPLLQAIAARTGGRYIYGDSAFVLQHSFLLTQHLSTGDVIGEFTGTVGKGKKDTAGQVSVDPQTPELRVSLNWPGSQVDLEIVDPMGRTVGPDYDGVLIWRTQRPGYVVIERPLAGEWTVRVIGTDVPDEGSPYQVVVSSGGVAEEEASRLEPLLIIAGMSLVLMLVVPYIVNYPRVVT